jgi:asparagine synthase (glutamine-hydrolysing)
VLAELQRMTEIYPRLDPGTIWHRRNVSGSLFTASMHTSNKSAAPRRYVMQNDSEVVFYSGLPVNSAGNYSAHHAEALSSHWDQLTKNLDGIYCIVRAADTPSRLELLTDITGMEQVFYYHQGDLWLISNSVRLIERICKHRTLDILGISLFLSSSWVWDDRTLLSDIRVIPGGQLWIWKEGEDEPKQTYYFKPSELARLSHKEYSTSHYKRLADELTQSIRIFSQDFDSTICALTGGRDTRFVTSLLIHAGLPAQYYTFGEHSGTDAKIAKQIAETFDLNYKLVQISASDVMSNWDQISRQIIMQGDGMVSIDLIPSVLSSQILYHDHLNIDLGGTGGELGKGFYSRPDLDFFLGRFGIEHMKDYLSNIIARNYGGIIRQEAVEITRNYVKSFVKQYTDLRFAPVDVPDVFFLYSRLRRKRGSNKRVYMQFQDFFSPFITRAFIKAVFSMSAAQRYTETFHYNIIRLMSPELHGIPLDKGEWRSQKAVMHLIGFYRNMISSRVRQRISSMFRMNSKSKKTPQELHTATDMFNQTKWFEAKREQVREFCLDNNDSLIWHLVNRSLFEKITSPTTDPADLIQYGSCIGLFYRIATLFQYEKSMNSHS